MQQVTSPSAMIICHVHPYTPMLGVAVSNTLGSAGMGQPVNQALAFGPGSAWRVTGS